MSINIKKDLPEMPQVGARRFGDDIGFGDNIVESNAKKIKNLCGAVLDYDSGIFKIDNLGIIPFIDEHKQFFIDLGAYEYDENSLGIDITGEFQGVMEEVNLVIEKVIFNNIPTVRLRNLRSDSYFVFLEPFNNNNFFLIIEDFIKSQVQQISSSKEGKYDCRICDNIIKSTEEGINRYVDSNNCKWFIKR